jgi:hypothetical protein
MPRCQVADDQWAQLTGLLPRPRRRAAQFGVSNLCLRRACFTARHHAAFASVTLPDAASLASHASTPSGKFSRACSPYHARAVSS